MILHCFQQGVDRFLSENITLTAEHVCFIDKQDASHGPRNDLLCFDSSLSDIPCNKTASVDLDQMPFRQKTNLFVYLSYDPCYSGLSCTRVSDKDQMIGYREDLQTSFLPDSLYFSEIYDAPDLCFYVFKTDQLIELFYCFGIPAFSRDLYRTVIELLRSTVTTLDKTITREAKASVFIFLGALLIIVCFAFMQMIHVGEETLAQHLNIPKMNLVIQIIMLMAAACNIMFCKAQPKKSVAGAVWQSGMVAVVAIYGIAWLADTYFANYMEEMKAMLGGIVESAPWAIAFVFFLVSVLINSQGAVVVAMLPLAYSLGIAGPVLLGVMPSVYGYFFIPNYPSDIATVNFDRSGTTVIGKYLLNHSFMMPGLISTIVATVVGYLICNVLFASYFAGFAA